MRTGGRDLGARYLSARDIQARIRHDVCMRMTTETTSYGEWPSPIAGADVARKQVGLAFAVIDATGVWWQESRPEEGGRVSVVCQGPDGVSRDLLRAPYNARTRVHEYGGRSYQPVPGGFVFANFGDQRLYRCGDDGAPQPLTPEPGDVSFRFADFVLSPGGDEVWCVRETSRGRPDHPRDRGRPAGRLGRAGRRRDAGAGQRLGFLRVPGSVPGRHPAGLYLLGSPADAVGRHRAAGGSTAPGGDGTQQVHHGRPRPSRCSPRRGGTTRACT